MTFRKHQEKFYSPAREPYSPPIWTVQSAMVNRTVRRVDYKFFLGFSKKYQGKSYFFQNYSSQPLDDARAGIL